MEKDLAELEARLVNLEESVSAALNMLTLLTQQSIRAQKAASVVLFRLEVLERLLRLEPSKVRAMEAELVGNTATVERISRQTLLHELNVHQHLLEALLNFSGAGRREEN